MLVVQEPLIFLKPTSSYVREGSPIEIPSSCTFLDHEVELGVVIGKKGRDISEDEAMEHVSGTTQAGPELSKKNSRHHLKDSLKLGRIFLLMLQSKICHILSSHPTIFVIS